MFRRDFLLTTLAVAAPAAAFAQDFNWRLSCDVLVVGAGGAGSGGRGQSFGTRR